MKLLTATALYFLVFTPCQGAVAGTAHSSFENTPRRALPNAPDGYTPLGADCASNRPVIRNAATLSPNETSWLQRRRNQTVQPMKDLLSRLNLTDFDAAAYITRYANNASAMPNIGIAVSGGGYRALMNGGGALQAFDSRTESATTQRHLGGLLQSSTYLAGLSGGGWLLGSVYINNFTTVTALRDSGSVWAFDNTILEGPNRTGSQTTDTIDYWTNIYDAVAGKNAAGFETSITDYWGRALANQLINTPNGGENYTWSSIALDPSFRDGAMPMPVLVADNRAPGEIVISSNTTVFEINPWEFGTFDPTTFGFAPLEYLGSNFSAGVLPKGEKCVRGFDNAGLIMGTSSSLFNEALLMVNSSAFPSFLKIALNSVLGEIGDANEDIADYSPNPFFHYNNATSPSAYSTSLSMVDGGEDLQNIPLHPLIQPSRHVDVIFAVDSSADTEYNWPNGTALVATYERSLNASGIANGTAFPAIPDQNTFVNLKLNTRPTFFGCNSSNLTAPAPLVVYIPNFPYTTYSNVSTFDPKYDNTQRNAIIENGYHTVTMANATEDAGWPACVACAILSRSLERTGTTVSEICKQCFANHCWDGTLNSTTPLSYQPALKLSVGAATATSGESLTRTQSTLGLMVALGVVFAVIV